MKCPTCTAVDLLMSERQGIEIDYCPSCRGVWLDRGELDKFIQRADQLDQAPSSDKARSGQANRGSSEGRWQQDEHAPRRPKDQEDGDDRQYPRHGEKKESIWSNLFDFG